MDVPLKLSVTRLVKNPVAETSSVTEVPVAVKLNVPVELLVVETPVSEIRIVAPESGLPVLAFRTVPLMVTLEVPPPELPLLALLRKVTGIVVKALPVNFSPMT